MSTLLVTILKRLVDAPADQRKHGMAIDQGRCLFANALIRQATVGRVLGRYEQAKGLLMMGDYINCLCKRHE